MQLVLYFSNGTILGPEVPRVVVPMDKEICKVKPVNNNTIDFSPLVTTCDVFPYIAQRATNATSETLVCSSSPPPNCDSLICNVPSNNDSLRVRVLPCHSPAPAVQLVVTDANGTVRFDRTFKNTTMVKVQIGGNPVEMNITITPRQVDAMTLGLEVP